MVPKSCVLADARIAKTVASEQRMQLETGILTGPGAVHLDPPEPFVI